MTIKIGYEQGYQQGKAEAAEWMKARDDALAELSAEIARLRTEILEADECITQSVKEEAALRAENEALRSDAERYRFLRSGNYSLPFAKVVLNDTPHGIDRAVDTEMEIWQSARPDAASGTTGAALESLRAWNAETDPDVASALDDLTKSRGTT